MEPKDLTVEEWREYDMPSRPEPYRINEPKQLYCGTTTHRIVDAVGVVHCVPAPGRHGCILRWKPRDRNKPVQF
jgi:hypothetical protein